MQKKRIVKQAIKENKRLIPAKSLLIIGIITAILTIIIVFFSGLANHRSLFVNSLISTTILSIAFIVFLTYGLFKGLKLKNDFGSLDEQIKFKEFPKLDNLADASSGSDAISVDGDDIISSIVLSVIVNILFWIIASIVLTVVFWFLGSIIWITIILLFAMLYWIFYRATRFVLKNSNKCKNNFIKSLGYSVFYTILYNCWIYGIIILFHNIK